MITSNCGRSDFLAAQAIWWPARRICWDVYTPQVLAHTPEEKLESLNKLQRIVNESKPGRFASQESGFGASMTKTECVTGRALYEEFAKATRAYFEAVGNLSNLTDSDEQFAAAERHAKEAFRKCRAAHSALEKHRAEHKCTIPA
jgi:hypothetical protein